MLLMLILACPGDPEPTPESSCPGDEGDAVVLLVQPYLQSVGSTEAWVYWETDAGVGSRLDWGATEALGQVTCGERVPPYTGGDPDDAATQVHAVHLEGLTPGSTIHYRARTGATESSVQHFRSAGDGAFRMVAMSDSQRDDANPDQFRKVVQEGVIPTVRQRYGEDLSQEIAFVLFPGDLVDNGWYLEEWQQEFFGPAAELFGQVPVYPAIGNHEGGSLLYFRYFHLPGGLDEHAYAFDRENVRVVALDSNGWAEDDQLEWLDGQLDSACTNPDLDFVFAQLHHPYLSELWTPGESDFTAQVVARMEAFTTSCGKPSVHFFGHTHGYSRGQSRDHQHLMVNVASAGGAIDRWGEHPQADYDEFSVSQDTWGFVLVEVETGEAPSFTLRRFSQGNADSPADNEESDSQTIWRHNQAPDTPEPQDCEEGLMKASDFQDSEGHAHQASHWQVASTCEGLDLTPLEIWRQDRNEYQGVDTQQGDDLQDEPLPLEHGCWRVRYRDEGLAWSDWSTTREC
jgi:hypothetical protein